MEATDARAKRGDAEDHIGFIRKVLGIVAAQMAITFAFSVLASAYPSVGLIFRNPLVYIFSFVTMLFCFCAIAVSKEARRKVPDNYFWLLGATLGESVLIAAVASEFTVTSVLTAIMATCFVTAGLFGAALCTSSSVNRNTLIRNLSLGIFAAFCLQLVTLLVMLLTWNFNDKTLVFVSSLSMVLMIGIYIIFVLLTIILDGVVDKEDYILAALRIYLEIARLFYYLLLLLGKR